MEETLSQDERVLLIGGTRGTGCLIAHRLLRDGYCVRALARNPTKARETLDPAVEVIEGDITRTGTLSAAMQEVAHIIFTAGVTQRFAGERLVEATCFEGVRNTLAAARDAGFHGRFLYLTPTGITKPSLGATVLNLTKRNTLKWRRLAEDEVRTGGIDYTIIRAGILTDSPGGRRGLEVRQSEYPLAYKYRISRSDVAEAFVQALRHPITCRTTFDLVGTSIAKREEWATLFGELRPDS